MIPRPRPRKPRGLPHDHDLASWKIDGTGMRWCPRDGAIYHQTKCGWTWKLPDFSVAIPKPAEK